jgi:ATP-dependent DNA helicase RecQ
MRNGHERLSVYGLLREESQYQVHDWINQLIDQGYLMRSGGQFPVIGLSGKGYWLLRPEKFGKKDEDVPVFLVETRKKTVAATAKPDLTETYYDRALFDALRRHRAELAAELGVPAFMVFGDRSLRDMARRQPTNRQEMLQVFGVGEHKLRRFGEEMIQVIRSFQEEQGAR